MGKICSIFSEYIYMVNFWINLFYNTKILKQDDDYKIEINFKNINGSLNIEYE